MAGIFNLFGGFSESEEGHLMKPLARSKTSLGTNGGTAKSINLSKPKGLSIRSNSDLNIPVTPRSSGLKQEAASSKQQDFLKPKLTQLDNTGRPISPSKEPSAKKFNINPFKPLELSPRKEILESKKKSRKSSSDYCFKKPLPPKKHTKMSKFPEPENLAPYYDFDMEFANVYDKSLEDEFKELLIQKRTQVKLYEDEGFESDPEPCASPDIPRLSISLNSFDAESLGGELPDLPELSDDEVLM